MHYLMGLIGDESETHNWEEISPDEMKAMYEEMNAYNKELEEAGAMVYGAGLDRSDTATTVRFDGERREVTDGPFAETKEWLAGFWVIECTDLDEALAWAKRVPMREGKVEVRPLIIEESDLISRAEGGTEGS
ncbi:MAG: YciI family protein [Solirubrobacterales bacterium]